MLILAFFGILLGTNGATSLSVIPPGPKFQAVAQLFYGYGYAGPFFLDYEKPFTDCGLKEFEEALQEYEFLDNLDSGIPTPVLTYYTTKFNHEMKRKVSCIVSIKQTQIALTNYLSNEMDSYK